MMYATSTAKSPRTGSTLRLVHLMEERQRLEIAGRITELRERSRWTQPQIAEKLGLTLRGYQKLEEKGTTKYERAEEIAQIHGVSPDWVWDGTERGDTPDVLGALSAPPDLASIHRKLDLIMEHLGILKATDDDVTMEDAPEIDQLERELSQSDDGDEELPDTGTQSA